MSRNLQKINLGDFFAKSAGNPNMGKPLYQLATGWNASVSANLINPYRLGDVSSAIMETQKHAPQHP